MTIESLKMSLVTLVTAGVSLGDIETVFRIVALCITTTLSIIVFIRSQRRIKEQEHDRKKNDQEDHAEN